MGFGRGRWASRRCGSVGGEHRRRKPVGRSIVHRARGRPGRRKRRLCGIPHKRRYVDLGVMLTDVVGCLFQCGLGPDPVNITMNARVGVRLI